MMFCVEGLDRLFVVQRVQCGNANCVGLDCGVYWFGVDEARRQGGIVCPWHLIDEGVDLVFVDIS